MDIWLLIKEVFQNIPSSVWGIIFGASISLSGVVYADYRNSKRQLNQFNHERVLKRDDREFLFRKETFIDVVEALQTGISAISRFNNLDLSCAEITKPFSEKRAALLKVHVIGNEKSVRAITRITNEFLSIFETLSIKRIPLEIKKHELDLLEEVIERIDEKEDADNLDDFEEKLDIEHDKLIIALYQDELIFSNECLIAFQKLTDLLIPTMVAIRNELNMSIDEKAYRDIFEEYGKQLKKNQKSYHQKAKKIVETLRTEEILE